VAEDKGKEEEKFDFTSDGEDIRYISLDQALLQARQQAQEDGERYRVRLGWDEIVWSEISSEEREDTFRILLQFRRPGRGISESQTGEEEFFFDQTGELVFRQVLAWPEVGESQEGLSALTPMSPVKDEDIVQSPSEGGPFDQELRDRGIDSIENERADAGPGGTAGHNRISLISAIKLGFRRYFDFSGRSTRAEYWWWTLFIFTVSLVTVDMPGLYLLFFLVTFIPSLSVGVRRLHDINKSGWWLLLILLSWLIIPIIVLFVWYVRPSK